MPQGGARVTLLPGVRRASRRPRPRLPIATQVAQFLASGRVDPNALYSLWGGGNDIFMQLGLAAGRRDHAAAAQAASCAAATAARAAGGARCRRPARRTSSSSTLPDSARRPAARRGRTCRVRAVHRNHGALQQYGAGRPERARRQRAPRRHRRALQRGDRESGRVRLHERDGAPPAVPTPVAAVHAREPRRAEREPDLRVRGRRPPDGRRRMQLIAGMVASMIEGAVARWPRCRGAARRRAGELPHARRAHDGRGSTRRSRRKATTSGRATTTRIPTSTSGAFGHGDADLHTISVGGDVRVGDHLMAGAAVQLQRVQGRFRRRRQLQAQGDDRDVLRRLRRRAVVPRHLARRRQPRLQGRPAQHRARHACAHRARRHHRLALGVSSCSAATGSTAGNVLHGPFAKLVYQEADVRQLQRGAGDVAPRFATASRSAKSLIGSLGWQVHGHVGRSPSVRPRDLGVRVQGRRPRRHREPGRLGGTLRVRRWASPTTTGSLFNFGASMDFGQRRRPGRVSGYVMGTATAGKDDGDSYGITVGVRVPL